MRTAGRYDPMASVAREVTVISATSYSDNLPMTLDSNPSMVGII